VVGICINTFQREVPNGKGEKMENEMALEAESKSKEKKIV
jgi:hypothetical protein